VGDSSEEIKVADRESRSAAAGTLPVAAVAALLSALLSGGGASYLTGSSVREGMVRIEGQMESMREELRRQGDGHREALAQIRTDAASRDARLRDIELWRAREEARSMRDTSSPPR
jgi:hypothetical protein